MQLCCALLKAESVPSCLSLLISRTSSGGQNSPILSTLVALAHLTLLWRNALGRVQRAEVVWSLTFLTPVDLAVQLTSSRSLDRSDGGRVAKEKQDAGACNAEFMA